MICIFIQNPRERADWPKIIDHLFIKENDTEKQQKTCIQESYVKWIIRLKSEKIFNLYECDSFISKYLNDSEVELGTKNFSAFDSTNPSSSSEKNTLRKTQSAETILKEEFWSSVENKALSDEGATSLRKDHNFSDKIVSVFKNLVADDKITDKKLLCYVVKILFNVLTKGKFENQNIDITKNQNIQPSLFYSIRVIIYKYIIL